MKREAAARNGAIEIDHDVPLPHRKGNGLTLTLRKMKVGDSFIMPKDWSRTGLHPTARSLGYKIATRTTTDGIRVWRVA